ncbi:DUF1559 domain-containing protein [Isosphaeraceae bacterium EP7]
MQRDLLKPPPAVFAAGLLALMALTNPANGQATKTGGRGGAPATAASLARYVPEKGLAAYAEFRGFDADARGWQKTAAYKAFNDTTLGALLVDLASQGIDAARNAAGGAGPGGDEVLAKAALFLRRGAVVGLCIREGKPEEADLVIAFRGGANKDVRGLIDRVVSSVGKKGELRKGARKLVTYGTGKKTFATWDEKGDAIVCGLEVVDAVLAATDGKAKSAETHPIRAGLANDVDGFRPVGLAFLDMTKFPKPPPDAARVGLDGVKRVEMQFGFQDEALMWTARIAAPSPRKGFLALLDQPTFDLGSLPPLPADLTQFTVLSVDPERTYDRIIALIKESDPKGGQAQAEATERSIKESLGIDLSRDLLRHLGPKLSLYASKSAPPIQGLLPALENISGLVIEAEVKDQKAAARGVDALMTSLARRVADEAKKPGRRGTPPQMRKNDGPQLAWSMIPAPGTPAKDLEPTLVVGEKSLVFSPRKEIAESLAAGLKGERWTPKGDYSTLGKRVPNRLVYLSVSDPRETVPQIVANLPNLVAMAEMGMAQSAKAKGQAPPRIPIRIDPALIPDPETLASKMGPGSMSISVDPSGIRLVNREAFPSLANPASGGIAIALLLPAVQSAREAARRAQCVNNEKQMMLAFHNYESGYGHFPRAAIVDKAGKPLLSWRVAILPFIEQQELYNKFHLDEAWDSPHNKTLLNSMPPQYRCASMPMTDPTLAYYRVFDGKGAMFEPGVDVKIADMTDGTSYTLALVETKEGVPWTKPEDLEFDPDAKAPPPFYGAGSMHPGGFNAGMGDGSIRFLKATIAEKVMKALITRAGGEVIGGTDF